MMDHTFINTQAIFTWLQNHQHYSGFVVFLISAMESIAIIGTIIPGTVMMTGIGALIGASALPFFSTILWAIAGAIAGDSFSFWIGKHFKEQIRVLWIFRRYPEWLSRSEEFFIKHGGKSVFFGRFIGPIRAFVPVVAGMMNLNSWRFLVANVTSAILWAPGYMLPGIFLGAASTALPPAMAFRLFIYFMAALFLLWLATWIISYLVRIGCKLYFRFISLLQGKISQRSAVHVYIQSPNSTNTNDLLTYLVLFVLSLSLFVLQVIADPRQGFDYTLNNMLFSFFNSLRLPSTDHYMIICNFVFDELTLYCVWAVVAGSLVLMKKWRAVFYWLLTFIISLFLAELVEQLLFVPYPTGVAKAFFGGAFPSRVLTLLTTMTGFGAFLIAQQLSAELKRIPYMIAVVLIAIAAITKVYLGIHWISDITAAILLGIASVSIGCLFYLRQNSPSISITKLLLPAFTVWLVLSGGFIITSVSAQTQLFKPRIPKIIVTVDKWWQQDDKPLIFYRKNRFGTRIEVMSVQCLSDLPSLANILHRRGWEQFKGLTWIDRIKIFAGHEDQKQFLPIVHTQYHGQPPALVMSKLYPNGLFLVLKLWNSGVVMQDNHELLWVGTLNYYSSQQNKLLMLNYYQPVKNLPLHAEAPLDAFIKDIIFYHWKMIMLPQMVINASQNFEAIHRKILLLQPR